MYRKESCDLKLGRGEKLSQEEGQAKRGYRAQSGLEREKTLGTKSQRGAQFV